MGGFGTGFGAFMKGYSDTIATRHAQKQEQFHDLMSLANQHQQVAERQRQIIEAENAKTVWGPDHDRVVQSAKTVMDQANQQAQDAVMQAEKAMNQKIGGIAKLVGMFKGMGGGGNGAAKPAGASQGPATGDLLSQAAGTSAPAPTAQEQVTAAPPVSAPAPAPAEAAPPVPEAGYTQTMGEMGSMGLPIPPPPGQAATAAPADVAKPSLAKPPAAPPKTPVADATGAAAVPGLALPPGYAMNPAVSAQTAIEQARARSMIPVDVEKAAALEKQQEEFGDKRVQWATDQGLFEGLSKTQAAALKTELKTGKPVSLPVNYAGVVSGSASRRVKGEDLADATNGKFVGQPGKFYDVYHDRYGEPVNALPSGVTAGQMTASDKEMREAGWMKAAHPEKNWTDDEALDAYRALKGKMGDLAYEKARLGVAGQKLLNTGRELIAPLRQARLDALRKGNTAAQGKAASALLTQARQIANKIVLAPDDTRTYQDVLKMVLADSGVDYDTVMTEMGESTKSQKGLTPPPGTPATTPAPDTSAQDAASKYLNKGGQKTGAVPAGAQSIIKKAKG